MNIQETLIVELVILQTITLVISLYSLWRTIKSYRELYPNHPKGCPNYGN